MTSTPLVLIPGMLNDADLWRDQVAVLRDTHDVRVADITGADSLDALAAAVLSQAPDSFSLAGFSLGGYVAQEIVRLSPERVERLALLDSSCREETPERRAHRQDMDRLARQPGRFHGFGDSVIRRYLGPAHVGNPAMATRVRAMTERLGVEVFLRQNAVERRDGEAVLRGFEGPMLLVCGEQDAITPAAEHEEMAAMAQDVELVILPGCGHLTPIEAPDGVSAALARWMTC